MQHIVAGVRIRKWQTACTSIQMCVCVCACRFIDIYLLSGSRNWNRALRSLQLLLLTHKHTHAHKAKWRIALALCWPPNRAAKATACAFKEPTIDWNLMKNCNTLAFGYNNNNSNNNGFTFNRNANNETFCLSQQRKVKWNEKRAQKV